MSLLLLRRTGASHGELRHAAGGRWQDWRYRSNAMGEREQKRLYEQSGSIVPAPDSVVYPWVYYLLGGSKQQHAVYHGQQLDSLQTECGDLGKNRVYLYAQEYISYGASDVGLVTTRPTGRKEYKLADHLGSTRAVLDEQGVVIGSYDLAPFGEVIATTGVKSRKGFIDKETDQETATGNFGVRQYNADEGRFTSVDPLWEQYRSQTPYHYSSNTPLVIKDPSGLAGNPTKDRPSDAPVDCGGGGGSSSPWNTTLGPRSPNTPVGVGYTPRSGGGGTRSGSTSGAATGPTGMAGMKGGGTPSKAAEAPRPSKHDLDKKEKHSGRYKDGQKAYRTNVPRDSKNNPIPDERAVGEHTRLQKDKKDLSRIFSGTEFNGNGQAVKRVDHAGRPGDLLPHQHSYNSGNQAFNKLKEPVPGVVHSD